MYETIEKRKSNEAARRNGLAGVLSDRLGAYAREKRGRFILYGSLARHEARYDSDVDLLIDFPPEFEGEAWRLAEALCAELGVESDIRPVGWCDPNFVARIIDTAKVIG